MKTHLREATEADAPAICAIYSPFVSESAVSFESEPPTVEEMARRIRTTQERFPWLVADDGSGAVGYAYGGAHRERAAYQWSVETSAYLAPQARRHGAATRLYHALFEMLVVQGFVRAWAGITLPNAPSVTFHEALGFTPIGVYREVGFKHDVWHDVGWWSRSLRPTPARPVAPLTPAAARADLAWMAALER